jgi:hypothetical protein
VDTTADSAASSLLKKPTIDDRCPIKNFVGDLVGDFDGDLDGDLGSLLGDFVGESHGCFKALTFLVGELLW